MSATEPLVWIMFGNRHGDNNQLEAIARAIGWRYAIKHLHYNQWRRIRFLRGPTLLSLTRAARHQIAAPWPDLVIGAGYGSVPVARFIRKQNGGRTRIVQLGNPRTSIDDIDLLITTPQYGRAPRANVLPLAFPVGDPARHVDPTAEEIKWVAGIAKPIRLIAVGGATRNWIVDRDQLRTAIDTIASKQGSTIIATSARTGQPLTEWLRPFGARDGVYLVEDFPRFAALLAAADEFAVTADSVSMVAEAVLTGRPVGIIPIRKSWRGKLSYGLSNLGLKPRTRIDLTKFWRLLEERQIGGTVAQPKVSAAVDSATQVVAAIRSVMGMRP